MKTNFDIDAYLRQAEKDYSCFGNDDYYMEGIEEEIEPPFNRKRILLLCR